MNRQVYETMAGPSEFFGARKRLKDWDVTSRLEELELPVLITSGAYDEVTPRQCRLLQSGHRRLPMGGVRPQRPLRRHRGA